MRAPAQSRESGGNRTASFVHRPEGRAAALAERRVEIVDGLAREALAWSRFGSPGLGWHRCGGTAVLQTTAQLVLDRFTVAGTASIQLLHQRDGPRA